MGMGEARLDGLSGWEGLFHVDSRISEKKKQNRMILIVKDFFTYPVVNNFPSVSNFDRYTEQKKK